METKLQKLKRLKNENENINIEKNINEHAHINRDVALSTKDEHVIIKMKMGLQLKEIGYSQWIVNLAMKKYDKKYNL